MNDSLFEVAETLSPKMAWLKKHGLKVVDATGNPGKPWRCFQPGIVSHEGQGDTEDEAIADWARRNGALLWNEEALAPKTKIGIVRPTSHDERILKAAAKKIAPAVKKWCNDDSDVADIADQLAEVLEDSDDAYELARELERSHYYSPDAELVEILDAAFSAKREARDALLREWVIENNLLPLALETPVKWSKHPEHGIGITTTNYPEGTSSVCFAQLGHVREGVGTHGFIIEWEQLQPAYQPQAASAT